VYVLNDVDPEGVLFYANAEGRSYKCIVTRLALSDHCSAGAHREFHHPHGGRQECLGRFHANREKIFDAAKRVIRQRGIVSGKVLVATSDFQG